jgi:tetratricopeptide (TPR) repeat protein
MCAEAYLGKAEAYEGLGDLETALQTLEEGYEKTEENADIKEQLVDGYLDLAAACTEEGDYEKALEQYDRLLELDRNNEQVITELSTCLQAYIDILMEQGDYDTIRALAEKYGDIASGVDFPSILDEITELESIVEFPFELTDFKVGGYTMLDATYEDVCTAYGVKPNYDEGFSVDNEYGEVISTFNLDGSMYQVYLIDSQNTLWFSYDFYDGNEDFVSTLGLSNVHGEFDELAKYNIELPVLASSYEEWCQVMPIQEIKEKGTEGQEFDHYDGNMMTPWDFQTKYGNGRYYEMKRDGGFYYLIFEIPIPSGGFFQIEVDNNYYGDIKQEHIDISIVP